MPDDIALWIKLAYTAILCVLVPVYWRRYGPQNFLWFSDVALIGTAFALWFESSLVASMMAVGAFTLASWNRRNVEAARDIERRHSSLASEPFAVDSFICSKAACRATAPITRKWRAIGERLPMIGNSP